MHAVLELKILSVVPLIVYFDFINLKKKKFILALSGSSRRKQNLFALSSTETGEAVVIFYLIIKIYFIILITGKIATSKTRRSY